MNITNLTKIALISIFSINAVALGMAPAAPQSLTNFFANAHGAGVLPFFTNRAGERIFIFTKEAGGSNPGTYDAFSGSKEQNETHPKQTAGHEFYEESMGLFSGVASCSQAEHYIDVDQGNTDLVIANARKGSVLYLTRVTKSQGESFANSFFNERERRQQIQRQRGGQGRFLEKNGVAFVSESNLRTAISNQRPGAATTVSAKVFSKDRRTGRTTSSFTTITLRPYCVSTLKPYVKGDPYTTGRNTKIRYY